MNNHLHHENDESTNGTENLIESFRIELPAKNGGAIKTNDPNFESIEISSSLRINIPNVANSYCRSENARLTQILYAEGLTFFDIYTPYSVDGSVHQIANRFDNNTENVRRMSANQEQSIPTAQDSCDTHLINSTLLAERTGTNELITPASYDADSIQDGIKEKVSELSTIVGDLITELEVLMDNHQYERNDLCTSMKRGLNQTAMC